MSDNECKNEFDSIFEAIEETGAVVFTDLGSEEHILFDLTYRWNCLIDDLWEDEFNCGYFRALAVDTFKYLYSYRDEESIPKDMLELLFAINRFGDFFENGLSTEYEAAKFVARSFCAQISDGWVQFEDEDPENTFTVLNVYGEDVPVSAYTFDLSPIVLLLDPEAEMCFTDNDSVF